MTQLSAKVLLLGSGAVGKTSLVRQFVESRFSDDYITTIGVNVKKKVLEDIDLKLIIWDLYGQKLSKRLHSTNYSGAKGALVVFDLTRRSTFDELDMWIDDLFDEVGEVPVVVLGNKVDITDDYFTDHGDEDFHKYMLKKHGSVVDYYRRVYGEIPDFEMVPEKISDRWLENMKTDRGFPFYETSAKTGENVETAFDKLGRSILESGLL